MKRVALLAAALVLVLVASTALTACDDSRVGTYRLQSMSMDGTECDEETLAMLGVSDTSLTLNGDSTCLFEVYGEQAEGTWDDTTVTMSDAVYQASWTEETLTLSRENEEMRFVKE